MSLSEASMSTSHPPWLAFPFSPHADTGVGSSPFAEYDESIFVPAGDDVELMVGVGVLLVAFLFATFFFSSPKKPQQVTRGHVGGQSKDVGLHEGRRKKRCVRRHHYSVGYLLLPQLIIPPSLPPSHGNPTTSVTRTKKYLQVTLGHSS